MKYHFLAASSQALDMGFPPPFHEGRAFISEREILSWFTDLDVASDGACAEAGGLECDLACL